MEIREAIEALRDLLDTIREYPHLDGMTMFGEAITLAISVLEKQEWHNAKTDPPKKPDNMWDTYYVYTNSDRYGIARYYAHGKWDGYDEDGDRIEEHEIIAYCNFKPYTERES